MSHSQFHCILFILRHAWLNLWDKHMLLAGSTRFLSFCFRTLTLTHSARPFFVRRTDERTSEEKEQEKHEGFSRFFFSSAATCDAANWVLSEYTHTKHPVQLVSTEHNVQTRFVYYLFRSFLASIGALSKRLLAERPKPILHLDVRAAFFLLFALGSRTLRRGAKKAIERLRVTRRSGGPQELSHLLALLSTSLSFFCGQRKKRGRKKSK